MSSESTNIDVATQVLVLARDEILHEPDIDNRPWSRSDLGMMLMEHEKPQEEVFPTRHNLLPVKPHFRGSTSLAETLELFERD